MRAFFRGGALTILSLDCLPDLTVLHVTCITGVEGPALTTLDFPMMFSGHKAYRKDCF